ncbi:MAG: GlsB/YeaQ/YmgE family stress response membrane protein [Pseudomonadota bacterium]
MALMLLVVIGVVMGWLASIVTRVEEGRAIRRMVLVGIVGAVLVGAPVNSLIVLGALSWTAMAAAAIGSALGIAAYWFYLNRKQA